MALDSRLSRLMPALNVKQRATAVLRAQNAGQDTADLVRSMPQEQRHEFNKYMGLLFVSTCQFGALVHVIASQIDDLSFDIERMALLDQASRLLEEDHPERASERVRPWNKMPKHGDVTVPVFLRSLAEQLREDAFKELALRWQELRAVELVADEIATSFDGEDPLPPEIRTKVEAVRASVAEINASLSARPRRLPEPAADFLDRTRELVDQSFRALGLVEE